MNEKEIGKKLLEQMAPEALSNAEAQQLARRVLRRDRRWLIALYGVTVVSWLATAASVVLLIQFYFIYLLPKLKWSALHPERAADPQHLNAWVMVSEYVAYWLVGAALMLGVAALSTLTLMWYQRRATLRQLGLQLAEISEHVKRLLPATSPPGS